MVDHGSGITMMDYSKRLLSETDVLRKRLSLYAGYIDSLMDGDTHQIEAMYKDLQADGFVDEDGFFIDPEDEKDG